MENDNITHREQRARELHRNGCNCCQAVVLAFEDRLPIDGSAAKQCAAAFGRGMSGMQETCGCVSGMAIVCGLTGNTMMFKGLATRFREEQGSLNCTQLLQQQGPGHNCNDLVATAARLLAEVI